MKQLKAKPIFGKKQLEEERQRFGALKLIRKISHLDRLIISHTWPNDLGNHVIIPLSAERDKLISELRDFFLKEKV